MSTRTDVRRRDRRADDAWIRRFLAEAPFGFLALPSEGAPHLNSNLFVYVEQDHAIYMHTARTGRTPETLVDPVPATFSAGIVGRLLPADEALEFSVEYASVVAFGRAVKLTDPEAKRTALQRLLDRYAPHLRPGDDYRPITDDELDRTAVYRIDIEEWTGKEKAAPVDFPGAFPITRPSIPLLGRVPSREPDAG
jgi:nitroimidazol reductase NimA-like FMN-containing flavoprotein (pyridoxamine 5'-phosphate oxidase superfamily)